MTETRVIYEDKNFIAVDKPAGLLVHKTAKGDEFTLADWLLARYPELKTVGDDPKIRPGIVHRLDRGTSGILVIARTQEYFEYLKSLFKEHFVKKIYLAIVSGVVRPRGGTIEKPLALKPGTVKRTIHGGKMEREASTEYHVLNSFERGGERFSLIEIRPITGRTHQIRVHLASIGHPVLGDKLYGRKFHLEWARRLMLHAFSLEFTIKEGGRMRLEAEPPPDFQLSTTPY